MKDGIPLSAQLFSRQDFSRMSEFENIRCRNLLTLELSASLISMTLGFSAVGGTQSSKAEPLTSARLDLGGNAK